MEQEPIQPQIPELVQLQALTPEGKDKLKDAIEEQELKNKLLKLKASWVKILLAEIKSIVLMGIFLLGTLTNIIIWIFELLGKKVPATLADNPLNIDLASNIGLPLGVEPKLNLGNIINLKAQALSNTTTVYHVNHTTGNILQNIITNHIFWQAILLIVLIPIIWDWWKHRNKKREE